MKAKLQMDQLQNSHADLDIYYGNRAPDLRPQSNTTSTAIQDKLSSVSKATGKAELTRPPLVVYASRTHSQLSQVVGELRKTAYRPKVGIIGSREQLCCNPAVRILPSNSAMNIVCSQLTRKNQCEQYARVPELSRRFEVLRLATNSTSITAAAPKPASTTSSAPDNTVADILDIEDLLRMGNTHRACAFYASKELVETAEIVFLPYNYLIDNKTQLTAAKLDLSNAIIIFDEAHNVESSCSDASSTEISQRQLEAALKEVERCNQLLKSTTFVGALSFDMISIVNNLLVNIHKVIGTRPLNSDGCFSASGDYTFVMLNDAGLTPTNAQHYLHAMESIARVYLEEEFSNKGQRQMTRNNLGGSMQCNIQIIESAIRTIFKPPPIIDAEGREIAEEDRKMAGGLRDCAFYRLYINQDTENFGSGNNRQFKPGLTKGSGQIPRSDHFVNTPFTSSNDYGGMQPSRSMKHWCFNPGVALRDLQMRGVRSIILTSGTLSPLSSFPIEFQMPFEYQIENNHVIKSSQVFCSVVRSGPGGITLNSSFNQRDSKEYQTELGKAVLRAIQAIPDGVLIFFPSYGVMESCVNHWKATSLMNQAAVSVDVVTGKPPSSAFANTISSIYDCIHKTKCIVMEPKGKGDLPKVTTPIL